jgi:hypothetical protein
MKKVVCAVAIVAAMIFSTNAKAQLVDEANVTITMDLQPILQLNMNGPSQIDFVFDQISEYVGGITQYGVTSLQVSSTVAWDLYAVGYASNGATNWDAQVAYGIASDVNALTTLPITALELRQDKANPSTVPPLATNFGSYNNAFLVNPVVTGQSNIYASATPYVLPADGEKYIAGGALTTQFVAGGSYLFLNAGSVGSGSNYYYTMDYRIVPGLPATFPNAALNDGTTKALAAGTYARPGVYTMNVKYVLAENI